MAYLYINPGQALASYQVNATVMHEYQITNRSAVPLAYICDYWVVLITSTS